MERPLPTLGQSLWPDPEDLSAQDFKCPLQRAILLGMERKLGILKRIFDRCVCRDECLLWCGPTSGNGRGGGYGRFSFEGRTSAVHRTVYSVCYGPIPAGKQIDHKCNNRLCCNPNHLQITTHKKNCALRDQRRKCQQ